MSDLASESDLRVYLAAAFRLIVRFGWEESVGNHLSAATSANGRSFLLNPKWTHFSEVTASGLLLLDADDPAETASVDASAWCIHGAIHRACPQARVVLHAHPPHATALASLRDPTLYPIDQNTARFHGRIAYDLDFGGMADNGAEGDRLAGLLADKPILMMGNHGVTVTAETVAAAFEDLYFLERAARTLMLAQASGQPLSVLDDATARHTAEGWRAYSGMADAHFAHLKRQLDRDSPDYRS
jgi:ribulose-5-phosphate 4-epimerase/fuculose-1-phosphate aldolase